MWLIGGEKRLLSITTSPMKFYGGLIYSGVYWLEDNKPMGGLYFKEEMQAN